ncbi:DUF4332 domain-containing protein [Leptolyngbya sp. O-77]|uniref:DUF4332 domain-containing protein n=1 Tax=Leptolyngbya sp. O-77 TaxID=1080068 RepID=UPI00074D3C54|nr:DUF4332 domain-containing protein [Leptolyngbya sp. O-77]BAU43600.1 hypothetical protein O77CONTIG1_03432 [Leptolyngbya sp. O-77]
MRDNAVTVIKGIDDAAAKALQAAGIETTEALLEKGATPTGRKRLAQATGLPEANLLRWLNLADLYRIKGIGREYADLLELAGVDTVPELAQRNPENLHQQIVRLNEEQNIVKLLPEAILVANWVAQAKELPRVIQY